MHPNSHDMRFIFVHTFHRFGALFWDIGKSDYRAIRKTDCKTIV